MIFVLGNKMSATGQAGCVHIAGENYAVQGKLTIHAVLEITPTKVEI